MIELGRREWMSEWKALNQAAELLLAQSSDWAFIMRTGTMYLMRCDGRDRTDALQQTLPERKSTGWLEKSRRWTTSSLKSTIASIDLFSRVGNAHLLVKFRAIFLMK